MKQFIKTIYNSTYGRNILWEMFGSNAVRLVGIIFTIILARILTPEDYGLMAMMLLVLGIVDVINDMGLNAGLIQLPKITDKLLSSAFWAISIMSIALFLLINSCQMFVVHYFNDPTLLDIIPIMSLGILLNPLYQLSYSLLQRDMEFKKINIITFISILISGIISYVLAIKGFGLMALVFQYLINKALATTLMFLLSKWTPTFSFSGSELKKLHNFYTYRYTTSILRTIVNQLDIFFIGKYFLSYTLGNFNRAKAIAEPAYSLTSSINKVFYPYISRIDKEKGKVETILKFQITAISIFTFFIASILYVNAREIIVLMLGDQWHSSVFYLKMSAIIFGVLQPAQIMNLFVLSSGKTAFELKLYIVKRALWIFPLIFLVHLQLRYFFYSYIVYNLYVVIIDALGVRLITNITLVTLLRNYVLSLLSAILVVVLLKWTPNYSSAHISLMIKTIYITIGYFLIVFLLMKKDIKALINFEFLKYE